MRLGPVHTSISINNTLNNKSYFFSMFDKLLTDLKVTSTIKQRMDRAKEKDAPHISQGEKKFGGILLAIKVATLKRESGGIH